MICKEVLLIPNLDKENSLQCLGSAIRQLVQLGITPLLENRHAAYIAEDGYVSGEFSQLLERCDLLLLIGGDGTILHSVVHAVQSDKPILGINTGRVGFLSQMEMSEIQELARLATGKFSVEHRMLLEAVVQQKTGEEECHLVLNDIVFHHKDNKLVDLVVYRGDRVIAVHRANGLIFATPTGSTAYSLAAGGSIADPALEVILLTSICPYSAYNRSFILPADGEYTVGTEDPGSLTISCDGKQTGILCGKQKILVRKSQKQANFLALGLRDFYSNLYDKLSLRR